MTIKCRTWQGPVNAVKSSLKWPCAILQGLFLGAPDCAVNSPSRKLLDTIAMGRKEHRTSERQRCLGQVNPLLVSLETRIESNVPT